MISVKEVLENLVKCNTIKDKENKKIMDYREFISFNSVLQRKKEQSS